MTLAHPSFTARSPRAYIVFVEPVVDNRENKVGIGQDAEDRNPPIIYKTKDSPVELVHAGAVQELKNADVKVTDDKAAAKRLISLSLLKFNCEIHGMFHSEIIADAEIKDAAGTSLWKGKIRGYDEHFGRNSNLENVREGLSNAAGKLTVELLSNPDAIKALQ